MGGIETYTREDKPKFEAISNYVHSPNWDKLCAFLEETYSVNPLIEYSKCAGVNRP